MELRWPTRLRRTIPPLTLVSGLLLLLTYLLFESRLPTPVGDTVFQAALQEITLHEVRLTRDVLLVRAGLLPHVDALAQSSRALRQALTTLRPGSATPVDDLAMILRPEVDLLSAVVDDKLRLVDYFTADNAIVQHALRYVIYAGHALPMQTVTGEQTALGREVGKLSHALLQLLHSPQAPVGAELLDNLKQLPMLHHDLALLVLHSQRVVDLLPQVDTLLQQLLSVPTARHLQTLHEAVALYSARRMARAQGFRLLLYLVALSLLGVLLWFFLRLQTQAQTLRSSEEHFRALTETASAAIISADRAWTIVSWNTAATLMFGYEASEALGMSLLQLLSPQCQATLIAWLEQGEPPDQLRPPLELTGQRQDSSEFPLDMALSTWSTAQGTYVTGMIRDLTARKRLEEQTRQQELQLIQANKLTALGTLVAGVAHEVNNPNQLVLMNTQMLAATWHDALPLLDTHAQQAGDFALGGLPYAELRDTLPVLIQDLHAGAHHIAQIIHDLRDFARPCGHRPQELVCLNSAVQQGVRLLRHLIQRHTNRFELELAAALPPVWGDAQHLVHVVVNLLVNALEALPDRDRAVRVSTRAVPAEECLLLEVADQGSGIAPEHLERLCDPFFTTKATTGGTGLGLAITATLVHAQGGRLTFQSEPAQGTRVCVLLPAAAASLGAVTAHNSEVR